MLEKAAEGNENKLLWRLDSEEVIGHLYIGA